jgi:hypothetical protein
LRPIPGIHHVGTIHGEEGRVLVLVRADLEKRADAEGRIEAPSIGVVRVTKKFAELVAVLNPPAAAALALVLRGGPQTGGDDSTLMSSRRFRGWPVGAMVVAWPPQRMPGIGHFVGSVTTLDAAEIDLLRGEDGGISMIQMREFVAHLSSAATEAVAQVLEEFATAYHAHLTNLSIPAQISTEPNDSS